MRFVYNSKDWKDIIDGEKNCFLLTNGLGGFSSLSVIGAAARGDQALLMAARKAPNVRWHLVSNVIETLHIDGEEYILTSQRMKDGNDLEGYRYLTEFVYDNMPQWTYQIKDVTVSKRIVMVQGQNTVAVNYQVIENNGHKVSLEVKPLLRFTPKNTAFSEEQKIIRKDNCVEYDNYKLYIATNGVLNDNEATIFGPMYFSQDERDGRQETGYALINHFVMFDDINDMTVVFSTEGITYRDGIFDDYVISQIQHNKDIVAKSRVSSELGKQLAISADAYLVNRESTQGKTIIAGYPFFEDWGRDTMIALGGITLETGRFEECKSILRTFAKYVNKGLLPNLFPEGDIEPMYNSVDAPLLFINSVYEYIMYSKDYEFLPEIWPKLVEIVDGYQNGTDYHIGMDNDYLISAGADLEQLTWMDVRVGEHLPTPRHGKPVEINAYWYNALCIMSYFAEEMSKSCPNEKSYIEIGTKYKSMSEKVKESFLAKFWNDSEDCLKDVLNGTYEENQVRCNQVWTLSLPFIMLSKEQEKKVLKKIKEELYTTAGLRTLSPKDPAFHEIYIGGMVERDKAYHQGTVWAFPLGAYYRACVKYVNKYSDDDNTEMINHLKDGLDALEGWLMEGCVAQLAEIYDGKTPTVSRGCFAQAWSVCELLRAVVGTEQLS